MSETWRTHLMTDHETIERVFAATEKAFASPQQLTPGMAANLRAFLVEYVDRCHNQKEERALFPLLEQLGIPRHGGPLAVMLGEHAQAKELVAVIDEEGGKVAAGDPGRLPALRQAFSAYAELCKGHFWKENDILYPLAERLLSPAQAEAVLAGALAVEAELGPDTHARYYRMAEEIIRGGALEDLAHALDRDVLAAILNTLPVELSFVDHEDRVRYFSHEHGEKIFPRTRGAIGTNVRNCHPQKSVHLVEHILAEFKAGKREVAEFWIDMGPRKVHIRYWPVRDREGKYLGCLETVQDVAPIQKLTGQRRLLDVAA